MIKKGNIVELKCRAEFCSMFAELCKDVIIKDVIISALFENNDTQ